NWSGHPSAKICHELSDGFVSLWVLAHFWEERGWNGHDVCSGTDGLVNVHDVADGSDDDLGIGPPAIHKIAHIGDDQAGVVSGVADTPPEEADVARTRIQGHQSLVERHSASRINGD